MLRRQTLPYEIRKTACMLYAGRTGFTMVEMRAFFLEEIRRVAPFVPSASASGFLGGLGAAFEHLSYEQQLNPTTLKTRPQAFEYWLSLLPLWRQKELLLELCHKPQFPMGQGRPSPQQRAHLEAMVRAFVIDEPVARVLQVLDSPHVLSVWHKAMDRCADDPDGAITAARTLLESVCKHILDRCGCPYDARADLPRLYAQVAGELQIAPSQHTEQIFKQILSGCHSVVNGLAGLRNQLGDAHGKGKDALPAEPYHAALAVNLAGSLALFLVQVAEAHQLPVLHAAQGVQER